jgi:hypothetical protein
MGSHDEMERGKLLVEKAKTHAVLEMARTVAKLDTDRLLEVKQADVLRILLK